MIMSVAILAAVIGTYAWWLASRRPPRKRPGAMASGVPAPVAKKLKSSARGQQNDLLGQDRRSRDRLGWVSAASLACRFLLAAAVLVGACFGVLTAQAAPSCRKVSLDVDLRAGEAFTKEIGGGLEIHLKPEALADPRARSERLDGWYITIIPLNPATGSPPQDRIYPANPPLQFNPWQDIGTSYGMTAMEKLSSDITYRFIWRGVEYENIASLAYAALWPYTAVDSEHTGERYLAALRASDTAELRLHPLHYQLDASGMSIRHLTLEIAITAPRHFVFADGFTTKPAVCPRKQG